MTTPRDQEEGLALAQRAEQSGDRVAALAMTRRALAHDPDFDRSELGALSRWDALRALRKRLEAALPPPSIVAERLEVRPRAPMTLDAFAALAVRAASALVDGFDVLQPLRELRVRSEDDRGNRVRELEMGNTDVGFTVVERDQEIETGIRGIGHGRTWTFDARGRPEKHDLRVELMFRTDVEGDPPWFQARAAGAPDRVAATLALLRAAFP